MENKFYLRIDFGKVRIEPRISIQLRNLNYPIKSQRWIQLLAYLSREVICNRPEFSLTLEDVNRLAAFRETDQNKLGKRIQNSSYKYSGVLKAFIRKYIVIHSRGPITMLVGKKYIVTDVIKLRDYVDRITRNRIISRDGLDSIFSLANNLYCSNDLYGAINEFSKILSTNDYGVSTYHKNALSKIYFAMIFFTANGRNTTSTKLLQSAKQISMKVRKKCHRCLIQAWALYVELIFTDPFIIKSNLNWIIVQIEIGLELCRKIKDNVYEKNILIGYFKHYRYYLGVRFDRNGKANAKFERVCDCFSVGLDNLDNNNCMMYFDPNIVREIGILNQFSHRSTKRNCFDDSDIVMINEQYLNGEISPSAYLILVETMLHDFIAYKKYYQAIDLIDSIKFDSGILSQFERYNNISHFPLQTIPISSFFSSCETNSSNVSLA